MQGTVIYKVFGFQWGGWGAGWNGEGETVHGG